MAQTLKTVRVVRNCLKCIFVKMVIKYVFKPELELDLTGLIEKSCKEIYLKNLMTILEKKFKINLSEIY